MAGREETNADGDVSFTLYVGTNDPAIPDDDPLGVGSPLSLSVTDVLGDTPIPDLPVQTARLTLTPDAFAAPPTPDELRRIAERHIPPSSIATHMPIRKRC